MASEFWNCDPCGGTVHDHDELTTCNVTGCENMTLCLGCSFNCADCGHTFCTSHIVVVPVLTQAWFADYYCVACMAARCRAALDRIAAAAARLRCVVRAA
jgi:hypothetical protein